MHVGLALMKRSKAAFREPPQICELLIIDVRITKVYPAVVWIGGLLRREAETRPSVNTPSSRLTRRVR